MSLKSFIYWQLDVVEALGIDHPFAVQWRADALRVIEGLELMQQISELGATPRVLELAEGAGSLDVLREVAALTSEQMAELNAAAA